MKFMIVPMGLTDEQEHIYSRMYKKCDLETLMVKYTIGQLVTDSNPCFGLTTRKIRTILSYLKDNNYIQELEKGTKGKSTTYKIVSVGDIKSRFSTDIETVEPEKKKIKVKKEKQVKETSDIPLESSTKPVEGDSLAKQCKTIFDKYNSIEGITKARGLTDKRKRAIGSLINKYGFEEVLNSLNTVIESKFLKGDNDRGWSISFDWFLDPNKFIMILEGKYDNKQPQRQQPTRGESFNTDKGDIICI